MRALVLDLFCGVGGSTKGYKDAGFDVMGVDIEPQPDFPYRFFQGDVFDVALDLIYKYRPDFIHASPPCQASTALTAGTNQGNLYPQLIPKTRKLLRATGIPWVIENVQGAPVRRDLVLCGEMFGLGVIRHRYFEFSRRNMVAQPDHVKHRGRVAGMRHGVWYEGPYFAVYGAGGGKGTVAEWQTAMGITWTNNRKSIAEAIPPAYTRYIGEQIRA